jgi:hypothetical protein
MYAQIQLTFWLSNGIQFYCIAISILGSKGFLFELFRSSSGIKILWLLFEFKYQPNINSSYILFLQFEKLVARRRKWRRKYFLLRSALTTAPPKPPEFNCQRWNSISTDHNSFTVRQNGLNTARNYARRYGARAKLSENALLPEQ